MKQLTLFGVASTELENLSDLLFYIFFIITVENGLMMKNGRSY